MISKNRTTPPKSKGQKQLFSSCGTQLYRIGGKKQSPPRLFFPGDFRFAGYCCAGGGAVGACRLPLPRSEEGMPSGSAPGWCASGAGCAGGGWERGASVWAGATAFRGLSVTGLCVSPVAGVAASCMVPRTAWPWSVVAAGMAVCGPGTGSAAFVPLPVAGCRVSSAAGTTVLCVPLTLGTVVFSFAGGQELTMAFPQRVTNSCRLAAEASGTAERRASPRQRAGRQRRRAVRAAHGLWRGLGWEEEEGIWSPGGGTGRGKVSRFLSPVTRSRTGEKVLGQR